MGVRGVGTGYEEQGWRGWRRRRFRPSKETGLQAWDGGTEEDEAAAAPSHGGGRGGEAGGGRRSSDARGWS